MSAASDSGSIATAGAVRNILIVSLVIIVALKVIVVVVICKRRNQRDRVAASSSNMDIFLHEMEQEKPIKFSTDLLRTATNNFIHLLGSGSFGSVYGGSLPNGTQVAVKVLNGYSDKTIEQQFMAEVSTIGRIHHVNLVRLFGFCFERDLRALVYEFMPSGSLDRYLFRENAVLGFGKLHEIAVGTARGIAYLHEECYQRIIHYDIKPGNVLLDSDFTPKVADFGLAKLCNRQNSHVTMTGDRGTPGYTAPEIWMPYAPCPVTYKCDVYSFGMLLFEIIGRRKNVNLRASESQEWFPKWVWDKVERGQVQEMVVECCIEEEYTLVAERMAKVALWCVQYRAELRPAMSNVVKMLEGLVEVDEPLNPFLPLLPGTADQRQRSTSSGSSPHTISGTSLSCATPIMRKYGIDVASA